MLNSLILGDCLQTLQTLPDNSVDLCYIDPPFFSNRNYEVIWGDQGEVRSFEDRWSGGVDHYIAWLKERVQEIHRVLKPTGSFYLHCDWHADAYIRVYILDKIFGEGNFRNEITWQRTNAHNDAKKKMPNLSDKIFYYSKSKTCTYNPTYTELNDKYQTSFYRYEDEKGKYRLSDLTGAGTNKNDIPWKNYNPSGRNRHWAIPREAVKKYVTEDQIKKMTTLEKLDLLFENGLIAISKNGVPSFKRYLENTKGNLVGDIWTDISNVGSQAKERIGYPTQKPEALLERIIKASSNEGDVVLDCFVGGGTTVAVADKLNRRWIGIDQSVQAIKVSEFRLNRQQDLFSSPFEVRLHKYDYDTLRYKDAFEFEAWIVEKFGGQPNTKQRGDLGLDGKDKNGKPIQVKRSDGIGRNVVDNFVSAAKRYDKNLFEKAVENGESIGTIIAFSFGKGAVQEVARLKNEDRIVIELKTVEDIVPIAKKPKLSVKITDLEKTKKGHLLKFEALVETDKEIEFLAWDWDYGKDPEKPFDPEILFGKDFVLEKEIPAGEYQIACKIVDIDGIEAMEMVKVKVNGEVRVG
jgi:DNA modification methylase